MVKIFEIWAPAIKQVSARTRVLPSSTKGAKQIYFYRSLIFGQQVALPESFASLRLVEGFLLLDRNLFGIFWLFCRLASSCLGAREPD